MTEYQVIRRLALEYVKLLYEGKIYTFFGHHPKGNCTKVNNTWTCEIHLYCNGPKISVLEVDVEYNSPKEYYVVGHRVKKPVIYGAKTIENDKNKKLIWDVADAYMPYINPFYAQLVKHAIFKTDNAYYTIYKAVEIQSKTLVAYVVLKIDSLLKPLGYNNLGDMEPYCRDFQYLPEHLKIKDIQLA